MTDECDVFPQWSPAFWNPHIWQEMSFSRLCWMATAYVQILMCPSLKVWYSWSNMIFVTRTACVTTSSNFPDKVAPPSAVDPENEERDMAMETFILAFLTAKV